MQSAASSATASRRCSVCDPHLSTAGAALTDRGTGAVTDNPNANMDWLRVVTGTQKIVFKYHVELRGWLDGVTFEAPGHISSLDTLYALITALARGEMTFVRLSPEEVVRRGEAVDMYYATTELSLSARADTGKVRPLRPLETRSARLRKGTVNKTTEWVPAEELAAEAADAAAAAAALIEDDDEIEEAVWSDDE